MLYFALGSDSNIYNVGDCGDYEAADESATDLLGMLDVSVIWLFDQDIMENWQLALNTWLPNSIKG